MRTIAFVSESGGSGKSTIAASLAAAAHEANGKVCLIDMDPQGSLMNWAAIRASREIEVIACGAAPLPALLASLQEIGVTLAILDTPGAEGAASTAAMREGAGGKRSCAPKRHTFANKPCCSPRGQGSRGKEL
jgi:chromosome partitioning protein